MRAIPLRWRHDSNGFLVPSIGLKRSLRFCNCFAILSRVTVVKVIKSLPTIFTVSFQVTCYKSLRNAELLLALRPNCLSVTQKLGGWDLVTFLVRELVITNMLETLVKNKLNLSDVFQNLPEDDGKTLGWKTGSTLFFVSISGLRNGYRLEQKLREYMSRYSFVSESKRSSMIFTISCHVIRVIFHQVV